MILRVAGCPADMSAQRLWQAGYRDLVSVVPPDADISPKSNLREEYRGKAPGVRHGDGKWAGYNFLKAPTPTLEVIAKWESWGSNVGLLGARYPGLDIDCDNAQLARFVQQEARKILGEAPIRTSRPPRRLLVYRTEEPFTRVAAEIGFRGEQHVVEVLGQGRQYLVHGRHPSGQDYGWEGRPLWDWRPDSLAPITAEKALAFLRHLERRLSGRATVEILGSGKPAAEDAPPQDSLEAPSIDELREMVGRIPNRYPDRASYIEMGCAIKAAGRGDPGVALDIFRDWAERWEGGTNEPETVEADWSRMHPPFRVGWRWIVEQAEEHGAYESAVEEFEADPSEEPMEEVPGSITGVMAFSDTWVVERVARMLRDKVRYVPETGAWHIWGDE